MSILVRYGVGNQVTKDVSNYPTVGSVLSDPGLQMGLGFGANVEAVVNGAGGVDVLKDGDVIDIRSRANEKG